ncbi:hypothetical protein ED733_002377 [Metarhizium rileyi]|uniref:Uncharacterized protein n=1 Tax=Metarhizium rileyi (strain RCEF 4871) TaxID=1649241 RepID=A0A5C6G691_METRR|nr:hypothetical protein ED733_002377 [Metarhizium rileyi]
MSKKEQMTSTKAQVSRQSTDSVTNRPRSPVVITITLPPQTWTNQTNRNKFTNTRGRNQASSSNRYSCSTHILLASKTSSSTSPSLFRQILPTPLPNRRTGNPSTALVLDRRSEETDVIRGSSGAIRI